MSTQIVKYGCSWNTNDPVQIEMGCIRKGGTWTSKNGQKCGEGLFHHYRELQSLLWPTESHTRWTDLVLSEILANRITAVMGPGSSWKTHTVSKYALTDYFCFPDNTGILISSTDLKGLERRVWGDIKSLHRKAQDRYEYLSGHVTDSLHIISTDDIEEDGTRDVRNGIICVPCVSSSGQFVGMGKLIGFKNDRVRCIGDEFQFMQPAILDAQSNYIHNPDYKFIPIGNPNPTAPENPLHFVCEPIDGWASIPDDQKTHVWNTRFMGGRCINLDGLDSPNNDFPADQPLRWPKLTNGGTIKLIEETYGKDSEQYYTQGRGVLRLGIAGKKIVTVELCRQFHAFDPVVWMGNARTKIGMVDAAYGGVGGDRCVLGSLEFGLCPDGQTRLWMMPYKVVPIVVRKDMTPEDQIATYCKAQMETIGVPPENFFFDGRGALGMSFARIWSPMVNSVEFGGKPTERPVSNDIFTMDDAGYRRLKKCIEHYSKFVSELWFSARYAIESDQVRGLSLDIVQDGTPREFKKVAGDRIEIEAKHDMKKRTNKSPDLFDMFVIGVEGARRRGFQIARIGGPVTTVKKSTFEQEAKEYEETINQHLLQHV